MTKFFNALDDFLFSTMPWMCGVGVIGSCFLIGYGVGHRLVHFMEVLYG